MKTIAAIGLILAMTSAVLAQTDEVQVSNWDDALKTIKCDSITKNGDNTFTVKGSLTVGGQKISKITGDHATEIGKRCGGCKGTRMSLTGAGC